MIEPEKKEAIEYRLKEAEESLQDALSLYNNKRYRSAVNRAYYSMFYSALALLENKGLKNSKHIGVISFFDKEYIKTNIFSKIHSKALHKAFELRQEADYSILVELEVDEVTEIINQAQNFVKQVRDYIMEYLF
ncbi:MAG: HEPN domain-containing protein [Leptospiraceae bacterium]|nr:HEPN domain-containing protein [Leptospiraceae bacterium]MBK9498889.1 HEPN domain-containing protein [Leptospiraceae bacterium]